MMEDIFTLENKSVWSGSTFWKGVCQQWTISDHDSNTFGNIVHAADNNNDDRNQRPVYSDAPDMPMLRSRLLEDGYALVNRISDEDDSRCNELIRTLRECIASLHKQQIPATFIMLCDETWELGRYANKILKGSTHSSNCFNFDVLAWFIDPKENAAGFSPHRDRQPEETSSSFHNDHQAKYVTLWIALSHATPENSCLYVIPKQYDPGYLAGDGENEDPLQQALPSKESFQCIRAIPRNPGEAVLFTHRILHWGSKGNVETSPEPRIAISFVCSDPTFEHPYTNSKYFEGNKIPPFRIRLLLVCAQLLIYYQRFGLSKSCVRSCYEYCKEHETELDAAYRAKVGVEFVKAMKEFSHCDHACGVESTHLRLSNEDDEGEEAVLEAMLEAEQHGYGQFEDDYDDMDMDRDCDDEDDESEDEEEADEGALFGNQNANVEKIGREEKKRKILRH